MLIHRVSWLSLLGRCDGLERFVDPPFRIDVQGWAADSCRRHRTADYSSACLATYCFGWNGRSVRLRDAFYRLESAAIVGSWCCFAARLRGVIGWLPSSKGHRLACNRVGSTTPVSRSGGSYDGAGRITRRMNLTHAWPVGM